MITYNFDQNGRMRDASTNVLYSGSPAAQALAAQAAASGRQRDSLIEAEVDAEADAADAQENREASNRTFQFALNQANQRRSVGGSIQRGGNMMNTLNAATGGLLAANQQKRRASSLKLRRLQYQTSPGAQQNRAGIASLLAK